MSASNRGEESRVTVAPFSPAALRFLQARDDLLAARTDYSRALREFRWPDTVGFNWGRDYFDVMAAHSPRLALRVVDDGGSVRELTYRELARRSSQVANYLASQGVGRGDRVLVMLGNVVPLWETMLAIIKLGAVVIPATTLLQREDLRDRLERGAVRAVVTEAQCAGRFNDLAGAPVRILAGEPRPGWLDYADSAAASAELIPQPAPADDELLMLYFTSGTTSRPKLVAHTHRSYPVGHLSTLYWLGLQPGDVHLNLSSAGWAKHAWSCLFAPFNAEATVLAWQYERFDAGRLLSVLEQQRVTTFCAPPTVWRMLVQQDMRGRRGALRELASAGEPLNPEVIEQVRRAWDLTVRDGYGQTETTAQIGNSPGQPLRPGSMGRPLPGYRIVLLDAQGDPAEEGEICIDLAQRPVGLMRAYLDDEARNSSTLQGGFYHTGDVAARDADGYLTYVGRMDDIFKSSDYRISPFELESVLIEHPAVAEAAVVPSPDPIRLAVPKAYVVLAAGYPADAVTALSILEHVHARVSPYKRIRCVEFSALPKTISGKIRRVDLRAASAPGASAGGPHPNEFWEHDFPSLKAASAASR